MSNVESLRSYWMPFTANTRFAAAPRLFSSAKGMFYTTTDGRPILDAIAGLWCVNAGHGRREVTEAIKIAAETLDFVSSFQMGHPAAFELCRRLAEKAPKGEGHVFLSNSGSEAVDTALKIARGYHRSRGEPSRTRFIGRARAYHGMGWAGLSVGGIGRHRRDFEPLLPQVSHMRHPYDPQKSSFSRGLPEWGADFADDLENVLAVHDPTTVAAVIVEPVAGSTGVFAPPRGYLERLRQICDKHGILLIFDEVITGFGRLGATFAAKRFGVTPDLITCAKGLSNGAAPIGATIIRPFIYDAWMNGARDAIEFSHGYTYSGHPLSCAAALATLDVFDAEDLWTRGLGIEQMFEDAAHDLADRNRVRDVRNIGLLAAIDLEPEPGKPGARAQQVNTACFEAGILIRTTGDTLMISPPIIVEPEQIDRIFNTLRRAIGQIA